MTAGRWDDDPDVAAAIAARDAGMTLAAAGAGTAWNVDAWDALVDYWQTHAEFFVDDFWSASGLAEGPSPRALGPLIQRGARRGWIVRTGRSRPSVRSNLSDKPIWRSTIYVPQARP